MIPSASTLQAQLDDIQWRRNFHPEWGAKQIQNCRDPRLRADYQAFAAAMRQAARLRYPDITVWYDPSGLYERGTPRMDRRIPLTEILEAKARSNARERAAAAERAARPKTRKELKRKAWRDAQRQLDATALQEVES